MNSPQKENTFSWILLKDIFKNSSRLFKILLKEKPVLLFCLLTIVGILAISPIAQSGLQAILLNTLINAKGSGEINLNLTLITLAYVSIFFLIGWLTVVNGYFTKKIWFFLEEKFELWLVRKHGEIDIITHEDPKQKNLFQKSSEGGTNRIQNFTTRQLGILDDAIVIIGAALILYTRNWLFLPLLLLTSLPQLFVEATYGQRVWGIYGGNAEARRKFWDIRRHFTVLSNVVELKIFQNVKHFFNLVADLFRDFHEKQLKNERRKLIRLIASSTISYIGVGVAVFWLISSTAKGEILIGTFTFYLASIQGFRRSMSGFFFNIGQQYQDSLFVTDIFKMLDLPEEIKKPQNGIKIKNDQAPEIKFENISFAYPSSTQPTLENFSLTIRPGEKIAIVGLNGSGQTTLIKLLCRFYDPTEGRILINDIDLKEIDLESWYAIIGVLFQDYANYRFLVKESVAVGRTNIPLSLNKVKDAASASESTEFIEKLEKAYDQILGKDFTGGVGLSVGQWQKLALARTFYRDPKVLILDEPTSSVDAESEAKIFEKLESMPSDHTAILISHRFSTVRQANRICVIKNGTVHEIGTHEELMQKGDVYAKLFQMQAKGYQ